MIDSTPQRSAHVTLVIRAILVLATVLSPAIAPDSLRVLAQEADNAAAWMPHAEDFALMWWADGPPDYFTMRNPPPRQVLCMQSGSLGVMLDTQTLQLLHAGRFPRVMDMQSALERGHQTLSELPEQALELRITHAGKVFRCSGRGQPPRDQFYFPIRFIESGRHLQRVVIEGLEFAADDGEQLDATGHLQLAFWPDRCVLTLSLDAPVTWRDGDVTLAAADRSASKSLSDGREVTLELFAPVCEPAEIEVDGQVKVTWDEKLGAFLVPLPTEPWQNTRGTYYSVDELDRLDRWRFTLANDSDHESIAPVMFVPEPMRAITGLTPLLCDGDGTPTGIPVQLSKNWHSRPDKGSLEQDGQWLHGCAFVRVPPRSKREFIFSIAYARWGGVPAASHAQLCLVGWGHNQFWDQTAIGSFGESICFEPGRVQRRCFITDVRPLMTRGRKGQSWAWAENCGGGDLLMWVNQQGAYRGFRRTRNNYRAHGPCRTDVEYCEETTGGEITSRTDVSLIRSDDYLRTFLRLRYRVLAPVAFQRLAFMQLGADYYNATPSRRVAVGDMSGVREEWTPVQADGRYDRRAVALSGTQPWVSIHGLDLAALQNGDAASSRGLIVRQWRSVLGGQANTTPYVATYATQWGQRNYKTTLELVPPPEVTSLQSGDFVEADLEIVAFPADSETYYGPNESFRSSLDQDADTPHLVLKEAAGNAIDITMRVGRLQRSLSARCRRGQRTGRIDNPGRSWLHPRHFHRA